jgi:hypothetical protein
MLTGAARLLSISLPVAPRVALRRAASQHPLHPKAARTCAPRSAHPEFSFDTSALPRLCPPHTSQTRVEPRPGGQRLDACWRQVYSRDTMLRAAPDRGERSIGSAARPSSNNWPTQSPLTLPTPRPPRPPRLGSTRDWVVCGGQRPDKPLSPNSFLGFRPGLPRLSFRVAKGGDRGERRPSRPGCLPAFCILETAALQNEMNRKRGRCHVHKSKTISTDQVEVWNTVRAHSDVGCQGNN